MGLERGGVESILRLCITLCQLRRITSRISIRIGAAVNGDKRNDTSSTMGHKVRRLLSGGSLTRDMVDQSISSFRQTAGIARARTRPTSTRSSKGAEAGGVVVQEGAEAARP